MFNLFKKRGQQPPAPVRETLFGDMPFSDWPSASATAPGGLHFGQGGFDVLAGDPMGGPVIAAATRLMQELIARTGRGS